MDSVGSPRAAIFGASEGGNMSMLFAATYPERTIALCIFGSTAKRIRVPEYPWAPSWEERLEGFDEVERQWTSGLSWDDVAPSLDPAGLAELSRYYRRCASPGATVALMKMNTHVDVRDVLPSIRVPTVVMHRTEDRDAKVEEGRYIARHIPGARFVEFPGADHSWWTQDRDAILDEVEELVTGIRPAPEPNRVLATVLFTDLVRSTERLSEVGDRDCAELLGRHHGAVRRELDRFRGREIDTAGDGFFAVRRPRSRDPVRGRDPLTSCASWGSSFARDSTPASASWLETRSRESPSTPAPESHRSRGPTRSSSRRPSTISSPDRESRSRIEASVISRESGRAASSLPFRAFPRRRPGAGADAAVTCSGLVVQSVWGSPHSQACGSNGPAPATARQTNGAGSRPARSR